MILSRFKSAFVTICLIFSALAAEAEAGEIALMPPPGRGEEVAIAPCLGGGQQDVSLQNLELEENLRLEICDGVMRLRIFDLTMRKGSFIVLPKHTDDFEFHAGNAVFHGGNGIISDSTRSGVATGQNVKISIDRAWFEFPPVTSLFDPRDASLPAAIKRLINQTYFVDPGVGLLVMSTGHTGSAGQTGSRGENAVPKECSGYNGEEPTPGRMGNRGNDGGSGGQITLEITIASGQREIEDPDVQVLSLGGKGGIGGSGGLGGLGAPGMTCEVLGQKFGQRSGFSPAPNGPRGPRGSYGLPGEIEIEITVAKVEGN